jgi:hypothetical protein
LRRCEFGRSLPARAHLSDATLQSVLDGSGTKQSLVRFSHTSSEQTSSLEANKSWKTCPYFARSGHRRKKICSSECHNEYRQKRKPSQNVSHFIRELLRSTIAAYLRSSRGICAEIHARGLAMRRRCVFMFSFGNGTHNSARGAPEFPEEVVWLWRDYDASKTAQTYELQPPEKSRPPFRVSITNRETQ